MTPHCTYKLISWYLALNSYSSKLITIYSIIILYSKLINIILYNVQ